MSEITIFEKLLGDIQRTEYYDCLRDRSKYIPSSDRDIHTLDFSNTELSKSIRSFFLNATFKEEKLDDQVAVLVDDFPFYKKLKELILKQPEIKKYEKQHGLFTSVKMESFVLQPGMCLHRHNDIRNNYRIKMVLWFTEGEFLPEDGGELVFSTVSIEELIQLEKSKNFFNADSYFPLKSAQVEVEIRPSNGRGAWWNNQDGTLIHEVREQRKSNKRYTIAILLGYKSEVNDSC